MKSKTIKILAILLTACVFLGVTSCSSLFATEEETTEARSDSAVKLDQLATLGEGNKQVINYKATVDYFNSQMAKLNSGEVKAKISYSVDYNFSGFDSGNAELDAGLRTLAKLMKDGFNAQYGKEDDELKYGDNFANIVPLKGSNVPLVLTMDDVALYKVKDGEEAQYEEGHTLISVNDEAFSRYEEAAVRDAEAMKNDPEATTEYIELDEDVRKITITLKDETDPQAGEHLFGAIYEIPDRDTIKKELDKLNSYVTYDGTYKATYTGCQIYMEVDRITDQVIKIEFRRNIEVEVQVTGNPNSEVTKDLGTTTLKFNVTGADVYEFDYNDPDAKPAE